MAACAAQLRERLRADDADVEGVMAALAEDRVMRLTEPEVYEVRGREGDTGSTAMAGLGVKACVVCKGGRGFATQAVAPEMRLPLHMPFLGLRSCTPPGVVRGGAAHPRARALGGGAGCGAGGRGGEPQGQGSWAGLFPAAAAMAVRAACFTCDP